MLKQNSSFLRIEEKTSTEHYFVGEVGAAWQFPSDHLPIGGTVGDIHFVAWNILDTKYLHHIVANGQGLRDSLIMKANVALADGQILTLRESLVVNYVLEMISHPTHARSLIALEETGEAVFEELQARLPSHMHLIPSQIEEIKHGDIFIYDLAKFDFINFESAHYVVHPGNTYLTLTLREKNSGIIYRFIQSHVPGGPIHSAPARQELAEAVMKNFDPYVITIIMGDMNRSPDYFLKDFALAAAKYQLNEQPFIHLPIPYPTHINTFKEASWIDNLFIASPYPEIQNHVSENTSELFNDLQVTVDLLESLRPH